MKYFTGKDHKVTLLVFYENKEELDHLDKIEDLCEKVYPIHLKKRIAVFNVIKNFFFKTPLQISYYQNGKFKKTLKKLLDQNSFDLLYSILSFFLLNSMEFLFKKYN